MSIFEDFYEKEHFIGDRKVRKNKHNVYRLWRNRIIKFLEHCDRQHIFRIADIKQSHYDTFIAHISKTRSKTTIRDWKYSLAVFVTRSHLNILIQTSPKKQKNKRRRKIYNKLLNNFDFNTTQKIMDILEGYI
jgi:hypothetical protein